MDEQSEARQQRDAFIADALREESHNAPKQCPGNDDRPRGLGLLSEQASVCFGEDFVMTEEELVDLSSTNRNGPSSK
jgi:hypothetical protein